MVAEDYKAGIIDPSVMTVNTSIFTDPYRWPLF